MKPVDQPVEGEARDFRARTEQLGGSQVESVWTFRVEDYEASGNRVLLVPVEMRARTFQGSIADGDRVRLHGALNNGTFVAKVVDNLTTGATVRAKGIPAWLKITVGIVLVAVLAMIAVVLWMILDRPEPPFPTDLPTGFSTLALSPISRQHPW